MVPVLLLSALHVWLWNDSEGRVSIWFSIHLASHMQVKLQQTSPTYAKSNDGMLVLRDEAEGYDFQQKRSCKVLSAVF